MLHMFVFFHMFTFSTAHVLWLEVLVADFLEAPPWFFGGFPGDILFVASPMADPKVKVGESQI